jgi:uncharacterized protein
MLLCPDDEPPQRRSETPSTAVIDTTFKAAWWLPGGHLQTLWGKFMRRRPKLAIEARRIETPDGDFLEMLRLPAPPEAPRLLVLHGLEGTQRSHYVGGVLSEAARRGWGADVLLFRSCGSALNLQPRFYHSGETKDLGHVLELLLQEFPHARYALVGFSLGGNVVLKWLGETGSAVPSQVRGAAAVSVPFDLSRSADRIGTGFSRVYERHFLKSLVRKARAKRKSFPELPAFSQIDNARTLRGFDDVVTAPLHGFRDAEDYYSRSSSIGYLERIRLPTLLLSAADDPFLPPDILVPVAGIARKNQALTCDFPTRGGHVGFVSGALPWRPFYYAEWRVAEFCAGQFERTDADNASSPSRTESLGVNHGDGNE